MIRWSGARGDRPFETLALGRPDCHPTAVSKVLTELRKVGQPRLPFDPREQLITLVIIISAFVVIVGKFFMRDRK